MTESPKQELAGTALYVAVVVVIFWLGMLAWLAWRALIATDMQWSRLLALLSSLEAVTFGAAGALFGTQIQRQRVKDALGRAEKAEKDSDANKDAAIKGRALAAAVKSEVKQTKASTQSHETMSVEANRANPITTAQYLARDFFPD